MGQYNFEKDIEFGESGESVVRKFLELHGMKFESDNKDSKYDLKMFYPLTNKPYTYEIKTDEYPDTGNLAVEFECRGKKSGIEVTEADYFLTYFIKLGEIWNIKTEKLKRILQRLNFRKTNNSGDTGSGTRLYLVKKEEVKKYFKIHKINGDYLKELIENDKK